MIARRLQYDCGLHSSLTNLGNVYYYLGDYDRARALYKEVLPLCQKTGDRASEAILQFNLEALAKKAGDLTLAEIHLQCGIALFEEADYPQGTLHAARMLAAVYRQSKQYGRALQLLSHALEQAARDNHE